MNAATLVKRTDDHGQPYLSGVIAYDLPRGSIVILKRDGDEYHLVAASDGRPAGDRSKQSLLSFVDFGSETPNV